MKAADIGDRVRIHFTGRLHDGSLVACSYDEEPLEFTLGHREVLRGLEDLVLGMRSGETRSALLPPDLAHGRHRNDLMLVVDRERFPSHVDPYTGQNLRMKRGGGPPKVVKVVATTGDQILLDTNHPLAGKDLTVEVELLAIIDHHSEAVCG